MLPRRLLCRHAVSLSTLPIKQIRPCRVSAGPNSVGSRLSMVDCMHTAALATAVGPTYRLDQKQASHIQAAHTKRRRPPATIATTTSSSSPSSSQRRRRMAPVTEFSSAEQEIWNCIQRDDFQRAIKLSKIAYKQWHKSNAALAPLTQFVLCKRQFTVECLYAGILASLHLHSHQFSLPHYLPFFAALLAERDTALIDMYFGLDLAQRQAIDDVFGACTLFMHQQRGRYWQARLTRSSISEAAGNALDQLLSKHSSWRDTATVSEDLAKYTLAAFMLRRPACDFSDVGLAGRIVNELLLSGVMPDLPVIETLVTSCVRCSHVLPTLPIYASNSHAMSLPNHTLISLVVLRSSMAKRRPRVHFDVLGTLVRSRDLNSALVVAAGESSREMFHVLLSMWTTHYPDDWNGVVRIVETMLDTLNCQIYHSTHHLAVTSIIKMVRDTQDGDAAKTILQNALALHFMLAPRLESPSIAAIHQLLSALTDHDRITDAFLVYRDAEMRPAWAEAARPVATEAIYSVLASGLARIEDIRSITHLTSVATSRGVPMSQNFYTAVICGLTKPQQVVRNHSGKPARFVPLPNQGHPGPAYAKRVQIAETLFESMHRHRVSRPTKVHHALMYAWALLGQHKKVQSYFDKLKSECENDHSSNAAINEATWGILMYAYTRAHNTQGALNVFARAAEWLKSSQHTSQSPSTLRTSYLINMAMGCFLSNGDPRSALAFLDESIARYSAEQVAPASKSELPATPADPVTLNLIVRALLSDGQLAKALSVYESIRAEYNIAEAPSELSLFLRYCMRHGDVAGSFELAERIMRAGRVLSDRQWLELMHLCANECSPDVVIYLYEQLCLLTGTDGKNKVPALLKKYPDMVRWVCNALKQNKRDEDAAAIHSALAANPAPAVPKAEVPTPPPPCAKAQSLALYRQLLRAIHRFPISNLRDKLAYNARFAFELYRDLDSNDQRIRTLLSQGKEQALWLQSWRKDTETVQKLVGSSHGSKQEK